MQLRLQHGKTKDEEIRYLREKLSRMRTTFSLYNTKELAPVMYDCNYHRLLHCGEYAGVKRIKVEYYDFSKEVWTSESPEYDTSTPLTTPPAGIDIRPVLPVALNQVMTQGC